MPSEDFFPGVAGGGRERSTSAEDAHALRAEKASQGEIRAVEAVDTVSNRAVGLKVECGATEVT